MQRLLVHNKKLLILAVFYTFLILVLCLRSAQIIISIPEGLDKAGHSFFHFGMVVVWFLYLKFRKPLVDTSKVLMQCVIISFILGVVIEYCQENFTDSRTAEIGDVYANFFGTMLGTGLILFYKKYVFSKAA